MYVALLLLFSILPNEGSHYDRADYIEHNTYVKYTTEDTFKQTGREIDVVFEQVILWKYDEDKGFVIKAWKLKKRDVDLPIKTVDGNWVVPFPAGGGDIVNVKAPSYVKTITFYDAEQVNRSVLPESRREGVVPFKPEFKK